MATKTIMTKIISTTTRSITEKVPPKTRKSIPTNYGTKQSRRSKKKPTETAQRKVIMTGTKIRMIGTKVRMIGA